MAWHVCLLEPPAWDPAWLFNGVFSLGPGMSIYWNLQLGAWHVCLLEPPAWGPVCLFTRASSLGPGLYVYWSHQFRARAVCLLEPPAWGRSCMFTGAPSLGPGLSATGALRMWLSWKLSFTWDLPGRSGAVAAAGRRDAGAASVFIHSFVGKPGRRAQALRCGLVCERLAKTADHRHLIWSVSG